MTCPQDMTVGCTGPGGAAVSFVSTATDGCDRSLAVTCEPPSGSLFPVGTTNVTCRATDDIGRSSECSFVVHVPCFPPGGLQLPGDCNQDGFLDISDGLCVLGFLFLGSPDELPCNGDAGFTLADWNGDAGVDITDAVLLLNFKFLGGPAHILGRDCIPIDLCPTICGP